MMATPNYLFGAGGDRRNASRHIATAALGRISFAGQETEGTPSVECALASGLPAANEVLHNLGLGR
jgi:hypothetical protein